MASSNNRHPNLKKTFAINVVDGYGKFKLRINDYLEGSELLQEGEYPTNTFRSTCDSIFRGPQLHTACEQICFYLLGMHQEMAISETEVLR